MEATKIREQLLKIYHEKHEYWYKTRGLSEKEANALNDDMEALAGASDIVRHYEKMGEIELREVCVKVNEVSRFRSDEEAVKREVANLIAKEIIENNLYEVCESPLTQEIVIKARIIGGKKE